MSGSLHRKTLTQKFVGQEAIDKEAWDKAFFLNSEKIEGADIFVSMDEWVPNDSDHVARVAIANRVLETQGSSYNALVHGRFVVSNRDSDLVQLGSLDYMGEEGEYSSDYISEPPSPDSDCAGWFWRYMVSSLHEPFQIPIQGAMSRYKAWFLLPDQVIGPFFLSIGENRWTHDATMDLKTMSRPPRDRLPWGFQPEKRPWKPLPFQSDLIAPGIHLEWAEVERNEPKLVISYNLPWHPGDRVKLNMDPFVLQGLDVPEGIKSILLFGFSRNENSVLGLDVPATPNGLGRCFGKVELDLRENPYFRPDYAIQSLFAVSGEDLAGPLPAIAEGLPAPRGPRPEM